MNNRTLMEKAFRKVLTDVSRGIYVEKWEISNENLELGYNWQITKRRLSGGLSDGVDVIDVNNGALSYILVPTRGMGIWKGSYKGKYVGCDTPIKELVHPKFINLEAHGGLGWLDGFNEWIVRCGLESFGSPGRDVFIDNNGNQKEIMLTLHGKTANIPASQVEAKVSLEEPHELTVTGVVYERSMFGSNLKLNTCTSTTLGSNTVRIVDEITNLRAVPDEMQVLYHCNYGQPFLMEGSKFIAPIMEVAPRDRRAAEGIKEFDVFGPPQAGFVEQVYYLRLIGDVDGWTTAMLTNEDETQAVSVSFSVRQLPYFTLWKNTNMPEEGYIVGLEPGTGYPNPKAYERKKNRVPLLKPKEKYYAEIALSVHLGKNEVQRVEEKIEKMQGKTKPKIYLNPIE
ncbi:aldose 1-epimerase family protein [Candidatus Bathyarchaeota archaeon]|nr:aldose 1-epimerase family protein [Candidatus Bathyarchaeota archaeon]